MQGWERPSLFFLVLVCEGWVKMMNNREMLKTTTPAEREMIRVVMERARQQRKKENKARRQLINERVDRITFPLQKERGGDNLKPSLHSYREVRTHD